MPTMSRQFWDFVSLLSGRSGVSGILVVCWVVIQSKEVSWLLCHFCLTFDQATKIQVQIEIE